MQETLCSARSERCTTLFYLPICLLSMFISFVFIGPIFKLLSLREALQGARNQTKTLIKMHKTLLLGNYRSDQQD